MGKKKIHRNESISSSEPLNKQKLKFSFEFYDGNKYCLSSWGEQDVKNTLLRLQEINKISFNDLLQRSKIFHFHEIYWSQTNEKNGFSNSEINVLSPFQFSILGVNNQKARVYGAYAEGVFYIVWFDYDHKITPSYKKHT